MNTTLKKINRRLSPGKLHYAPSWIVLGVNNLCNLHCKMCDVGTQSNDTNFAVNLVGTRPLNMPIELFERVVDQCAKYYPKTKLGYAFTEPLIYPHLEESLAYAKSKGLYTSITTNALNLRLKTDMMIENGVSDIFISLDGTEEIHNHIRGHKKSFQWAIEGMEKILAKTNAINFSIYFVITEWNTHNLVDFAEYFRKFPIKQMGFLHPNYTLEHTANEHNSMSFGQSYPATHSNIEEVDPSKIDLKLLQSQITTIKSRQYPFEIVFQPDIVSDTHLNQFYAKPESFFGKGCTDIFQNIMLKSDGSMIPAHGRCYNISAGNLYDTDLPEIWNSAILTNFRKTVAKNGGYLPACSRCCSAF